MKDTTEIEMEAGSRGFPPSHPGRMLRTVHLPELKEHGITLEAVAEALAMSRQNLHLIVQEKRAVTPEVAVRLAAYLGGSATLWLTLQAKYDVWRAEQTVDVSAIRPALPRRAGEA